MPELIEVVKHAWVFKISVSTVKILLRVYHDVLNQLSERKDMAADTEAVSFLLLSTRECVFIL